MTGAKGISASKRFTFGVSFVVVCVGLLLNDSLTDVTFMQATAPVVATLILAQTWKDVKDAAKPPA